MNKKIIACALGALVAMPAGAVDLRHYVGLRFSNIVSGTVDIEDSSNVKIKEQFGLGGQYGIRLSCFRTELEYMHYFNADLRKSDADIAQDVLFLNGYYDLNTNSPFSFYGTVGLGYNRMTVESDHDTAFAYKAGLGMMWDIAPHWGIDIGYRYVSFGNFSSDDVDVSVDGHEIAFTARYFF